MKRASVLVMVVCAMMLSGCNTVEGMGKDLRKAGDAIEKAVK
ncbi:MAG: entericidin A/B family lipoprotein [Betaproteobacteria bacterium]|nr:entericidin A/B family lipoprotein [Betaproteobacteria bacterium]